MSATYDNHIKKIQKHRFFFFLFFYITNQDTIYKCLNEIVDFTDFETDSPRSTIVLFFFCFFVFVFVLLFVVKMSKRRFRVQQRPTGIELKRTTFSEGSLTSKSKIALRFMDQTFCQTS